MTPTVSTFSIIARDAATGELGVAVASKFIAVGAVVPWARAGVGAIATQAWANTSYGPRGLAMLEGGHSPRQTLDHLLAVDPHVGHRQVGLIHADGRTAATTGEKCYAYAGHLEGSDHSVQGNILLRREVLEAMSDAWVKMKGDLADRMLEALAAGQEAGGDRRGRQSAAILIVRKGWGYGGFNDRYRDLRVDDHEYPIEELRRVLELHKRVFPRPH